MKTENRLTPLSPLRVRRGERMNSSFVMPPSTFLRRGVGGEAISHSNKVELLKYKY
jgi:hypothetical protein